MIYRNIAVAILVGCSGSVAAFNYSPCPPGAARLCSRSERCTSDRCASQPLHESLESSGDCERYESRSSSRRSVLRHFAHVFAATAFAWKEGHDAAIASEFSAGADDTLYRQNLSKNYSTLSDEASKISTNPQVEQQDFQAPKLSAQNDVQQVLAQEYSPRDFQQYASEFVPRDMQQNAAQIAGLPLAKLPINSSSTTQVTLENSQVITIPTKQVPVASPTQSSKVVSSAISPASKSTFDKPSPKQQNSGIALVFELSITTTVLGAVGKAVSGRMASNTDELTARAKVVLVENEPYGLAKGRRYYNGIDITRNDPVPASDVLKYCDAGVVNNDCAELITDFLGEVQSNSEKGLNGPSMRQKETATAVLSYLDTLSSCSDASSKTAEAFSSYLNGLSNGEVEAPASPQAVAGYLESLNKIKDKKVTSESKSQQFQGDMTRLIETFLISSDDYETEENVYGKYEQANGSRMQLNTVP